MLRSLFSSKTTKADCVMAVAAAVIGVWKATDTVKKYRSEQERSEEEKAK
jgi:hypothetical protein